MDQQSVGIVILGAGGYMGSSGIRALKHLLPELTASNLHPKFLCLVEPVEEKLLSAIALCKKCTDHPVIAANKLPEALLHLNGTRMDEKYPVLVYDATPTTLHHDNLVDLHQHDDNSLFYLCEKPIFTDEFEQRYITHNTGAEFEFFCELIETENPVFLEVRKHLSSKPEMKLTRIALWRAGCSGIKKAISISRSGVEGGALEDKSLHDFSITVGLLGRENISQFQINKSEIHSLILHNNFYFNNGERVFLNVCNHPTPEIVTDLKKIELLPADGLLSMDVSWMLANRVVESHYLFSWVGFNGQPVEQRFADELTSLGFPLFPSEREFPNLEDEPRNWLDISEPFKSKLGTDHFEAKMQEIRVGVFTCELPDGSNSYVVCNFLSKYGARRFAYEVEQTSDGPVIRERLFVDPPGPLNYDENKAKELSQIFRNVIYHAAGGPKAELIDRETTLLVHDLLIQGRKQALADLTTDPKHWFDIAEAIFRNNVMKSPA